MDPLMKICTLVVLALIVGACIFAAIKIITS